MIMYVVLLDRQRVATFTNHDDAVWFVANTPNYNADELTIQTQGTTGDT